MGNKNMNINEVVRKNIIIYMNQKKISTRDIMDQAEKLCGDSIYKYIRGLRKISLESCLIFSKAFNINIKDLFDEDNYNKFKDTYKNPYKGYKITKNLHKIKESKHRDQVIYFYRKLSNNKKTLKELGNEFNISKERVRQIEKKIINNKTN